MVLMHFYSPTGAQVYLGRIAFSRSSNPILPYPREIHSRSSPYLLNRWMPALRVQTLKERADKGFLSPRPLTMQNLPATRCPGEPLVEEVATSLKCRRCLAISQLPSRSCCVCARRFFEKLLRNLPRPFQPGGMQSGSLICPQTDLLSRRGSVYFPAGATTPTRSLRNDENFL